MSFFVIGEPKRMTRRERRRERRREGYAAWAIMVSLTAVGLGFWIDHVNDQILAHDPYAEFVQTQAPNIKALKAAHWLATTSSLEPSGQVPAIAVGQVREWAYRTGSYYLHPEGKRVKFRREFRLGENTGTLSNQRFHYSYDRFDITAPPGRWTIFAVGRFGRDAATSLEPRQGASDRRLGEYLKALRALIPDEVDVWVMQANNLGVDPDGSSQEVAGITTAWCPVYSDERCIDRLLVIEQEVPFAERVQWMHQWGRQVGHLWHKSRYSRFLLEEDPERLIDTLHDLPKRRSYLATPLVGVIDPEGHTYRLNADVWRGDSPQMFAWWLQRLMHARGDAPPVPPIEEALERFYVVKLPRATSRSGPSVSKQTTRLSEAEYEAGLQAARESGDAERLRVFEEAAVYEYASDSARLALIDRGYVLPAMAGAFRGIARSHVR